MPGTAGSALSCAIDDLAEQGSHLVARFFGVSSGHMFHEDLDSQAFDQVDRGSTKTAACEARAEAGRMFACKFHQEVKFGSAIAEIIA